MGLYIVVRGHPRSLNQRNKEQPMNAVPVENSEQIEDDKNLAAVSDVEAGIRDFVRKDIAYLRRPAAASTDVPADSLAEASVNSVSTLVQRVAGASVSEIETLIAELEGLRDLMHNEGQRIQRELAGYAQLGQTALKSTRMIADNLAQWKRTAPEQRQD